MGARPAQLRAAAEEERRMTRLMLKREGKTALGREGGLSAWGRGRRWEGGGIHDYF